MQDVFLADKKHEIFLKTRIKQLLNMKDSQRIQILYKYNINAINNLGN